MQHFPFRVANVGVTNVGVRSCNATFPLSKSKAKVAKGVSIALNSIPRLICIFLPISFMLFVEA